MKPNQNIKKEDNEKDQWKKLLDEARKSRQLNNKTIVQKSINSKSQLKNNSIQLINSNSNQLNRRDNIDLVNNLSNSGQANSITSQNNLILDEIINEIQNKITSKANNQPVYLEQQELRRRELRKQLDERQCRVCFLNNNEQLFRPCKCNGTMAFIHRSCLRNWIKVNKSKNCNICYARYLGLRITYRFLSHKIWLIKDIDNLKKIFSFLFFYISSLSFHLSRSIDLYLNELRNYLNELKLIEKLNQKLINEIDLDFKISKIGKLQFSKIIKYLNESSIESKLIQNVSNSEFNYLSILTNTNNQLKSKIYLNRPQLNETIDDYQLNEFTYSLTIYIWYIIVYLINDLAQFIIYIIVLSVFLRYFKREFLIWRYENRIAEIEFNDRLL